MYFIKIYNLQLEIFEGKCAFKTIAQNLFMCYLLYGIVRYITDLQEMWIKKIFGMPEAKISLFQEIQCAKEWQRFLRRTFLKLSQLLSHRCLSFRRYRGDIVAWCSIPADCLPNDKSTVFCLHNRLSNKIFQIQLDLSFFL